MNFFVLKIFFITLILCLFKASDASESVDISRDFKILLMYFSEAFLKGAVFDGKKLEGDSPIEVARDLVKAIETVETEYPGMPDLADLILFKEQLASGIPIAESIKYRQDTENVNKLSSDAMTAQAEALEALNKNGGLVLPFGWIGHALTLVIKKGKAENLYDFAVVNTGQGIQYHYHSADPNGIYPSLSQIWVEFVDVKATDLFSDDAWFFQGLIAFETKFFQDKLKKQFTPLEEPEYKEYYPEYFYGSFLSNFNGNLVPHRNDRLTIMQRSGSCTVSSLIGALLYSAKAEDTFYFYRLKIGHALIKSFLTKAKDNEKFKKIISDGFETNGRNLLKVIGSSLAQKTLEYLEFVLPEDFRHAGLIGSNRFKWIFENKEKAKKALLKADSVVLESIEISVQLNDEIKSLLKENPISISSNDIVLTKEAKSKYVPIKTNLGYTRGGAKCLYEDFYDFLKGTCNRPEEPITSFHEFYDELKDIVNKFLESDKQVFYRILNIFKRAHEFFKNEKWIETGTDEQILDLQNVCKDIAKFFARTGDKLVSFDDIVLLAYLQKLSWISAVAYDQKLEEEKRIGLASLAPPQTLQSVLFGFEPIKENGKVVKILAGNLKRWIIHNCFDQRNVEIFMELLEQDKIENSKDHFMGPESFCDPGEDEFEIVLPERNRDIYWKMMEHPKVEEILNQLMKKQDLKNTWTNVEPSLGKFIIVFSKGQSELSKYFLHYYNLMFTLSILRANAIENANLCLKADYWTAADINKVDEEPNKVMNACRTYSEDLTYYKNSYLEILENRFYIRSSRISDNYRRNDRIFHRARHSEALTENIDIVSLETWFNYIKDATSAKLFDSIYFQYISDHLLNVPKFDKDKNIMFPVDEVTASSIIEELTRLIKVTLDTLKVKNQEISIEKRKTLIVRSVTISVILTRFISRIDSVKILSGFECAKSLARIYNLLVPFAKFKTDYILAEQEISRINFALGHICSINMRNALTFMEHADIGISQKGLRKTLKRYHWFAAKKSYIANGTGTGVADDQFNYDRSGTKMIPEETSFLKELLIKYFLSGLVDDASSYIFKYNYERDLVYIQDSVQDPVDGVNFILNMWTGAVVINGFCIINNSIFINSKEFQDFFSVENLPLVSNGLATEAAGKSIYAIPDFKGSSYLVSRGNGELTIHRKWNGNWFDFTPFDMMNHYKYYFKGVIFDFDWIKNNAWIFRRDFNKQSKELILILKGEKNPILRLIVDENSSTIKIAVEGFDEGNSWTILSKDVQNDGFVVPRHIEAFTRGIYILAKDENDRIVIICMNLRLQGDKRRPIVFKEIEGTDGQIASSFEILNLTKTEVFPNQSLGEGSCLPGGLVIISDSKKALIIAKAEKKENFKSTIEVERIPILDDLPAPQSREHKLLLAYYMILQFEFNSARELLHPSASIHQNEVFSLNEIKILKWIAAIDLEAPEALALKIFAFLHYEINRTKFLLEHSKNNYNLEKVSIPRIKDYLFTIREMSEKYYIFLAFPEVLKDIFQ